MFDRPTATFPLGIEQDGKLLRGALLYYNHGKPKIERLFTVALEITEPAVVCVLAPLQMINPPLPRDRQRRALLITGMATDQMLIRPLDLKLKKVKDIDAVLAFQAEPLLPYPVENAVIDRWILGVEEETTTISVLSVRKDHLQEHLSFHETIKIEPEVVSCYPAGLASFAKHYAHAEGLIFAVHLARKMVSCCLVENGRALAAHAIPSGAEAILECTRSLSSEQLLETDFHALTAGSPLAAATDALRQAIVRTVFSLTKQARSKEINAVLITGEGATVGNLPDHLASLLKKKLLMPPALDEPSITVHELLTYAIPIGLAHSALALPSAFDQINFRRGDFSYPNPWRRLKKPMAIYISCSLLLTLAIFLTSYAVHSNQEHRLQEQYLHLLEAAVHKDYRSYELELAGKEPTAELLMENPVTEVRNLSASDIETRLNRLQKEIEESPDIFPLQPDIPKVSDVLGWLSSHTKATKVDPKTGAKSPLLRIESFNYSMVSRPDKNKPKDRYQVKVDLDFSSADSKAAREFYDALVEPNEIVDPRSEVTWSAGQGRYRVSFFLRDRTPYP